MPIISEEEAKNSKGKIPLAKLALLKMIGYSIIAIGKIILSISTYEGYRRAERMVMNKLDQMDKVMEEDQNDQNHL